MGSSDLGEAFVQTLLDCGIVRQTDLDETMEASGELGAGSVTDILLERGFLNDYQMRKLLRRTTHHALVCHHCHAKVVVKKERYEGSTDCTACEETISLDDGTASFGETLVIDNPRRMIDGLLAKFLVKREILDSEVADELLEKAAKTRPRQSFDRYLIENDILEFDEIRPIQRAAEGALRSRYPFFDRMREDVELGRFLVQIGLVSLNRLNKCLLRQTEEARGGKFIGLRNILVQAKQLTSRQLEDFLQRQFDRLSQRTDLLERRRSEAMTQLSADDLEEDSGEDHDSDFGLVTIDLGDDDADEDSNEAKEDTAAYDPTALDPGNLLKVFLEKTYGKKEEQD